MKEIRCSYTGVDGLYYTGDNLMDGSYKYFDSEVFKPLYICFFIKGRQEGEEVDYSYSDNVPYRFDQE